MPASTVTCDGGFVQRKSHAAAAGGAGASGIKSGLAAVRNFGLAEFRFGSNRDLAFRTLMSASAGSVHDTRRLVRLGVHAEPPLPLMAATLVATGASPRVTGVPALLVLPISCRGTWRDVPTA
jgi:hypothetical protein